MRTVLPDYAPLAAVAMSRERVTGRQPAPVENVSAERAHIEMCAEEQFLPTGDAELIKNHGEMVTGFADGLSAVEEKA